MDVDMETHPNPQPNPHHRKVDLQSAHDLTYLQNNLATFALQKLDLHFPKLSKPATYISLDLQPQPNDKNAPADQKQNPGDQNDSNEDEEDPMRRRVRDLVREFLTTTWQSASHNISVNGIDASSLPVPHAATLSPAPPPPFATTTTTSESASSSSLTSATEIEGIHFQHSPFDPSLQRKLASLHGELETLTARVSKLRRTAPAQGADTYERRLRTAMDIDDARWNDETLKEEEDNALDIDDVPRPDWNRDVRDTYARGLETLTALAAGPAAAAATANTTNQQTQRGATLTETVGKAQRARTVAMEME